MISFDHVLCFLAGSAIMGIICLGIAKKNIQAFEASAKKALEELGSHAKSKIEEFGKSIMSYLDKK